ncbi:MAG: hypothetical protein ACREQN_00415 [Candidatus Binataceae bacterium]
MKFYVLPSSPRALKVIALKNHLELDCEMQLVDLAGDEHLAPEFATISQSMHGCPLRNRFGFRSRNTLRFSAGTTVSRRCPHGKRH